MLPAFGLKPPTVTCTTQALKSIAFLPGVIDGVSRPLWDVVIGEVELHSLFFAAEIPDHLLAIPGLFFFAVDILTWIAGMLRRTDYNI